MQKIYRDVGYLVDGALEDLHVALGGLVKAADFSDELERSCSNLFAGHWRFEIEERFNIPAHFL